MIIQWILGLLFGVLNAVLDLIPPFTAAQGWGDEVGINETTGQFAGWGPWSDFISSVVGFMWTFDLFVPIRLGVTAMVVLGATRLFVALVQFVIWLWDRLPFKSS